MAAAKDFLSFLLIFGAFLLNLSNALEAETHVSFVLVGATGSLAKKYLWQGLYDLHATGPEPRVAYFGGARAPYEEGNAAMRKILKSEVKYGAGTDIADFDRLVNFVQLKTFEQYETFCRGTLDRLDGGVRTSGADFCQSKSDCGSSKSREVGRIFYLAVPPFSYGELADWLHRVCRPAEPTAWIRIVLEKPYGTDSDSVASLLNRVKTNFFPHELYLVDHYLGKAAAQSILPLRLENNSTLETFLNNEFVERIEVAIKESEDVKGRMAFYDSYGVFLDILQNHAMEMLTLIAMDLPANLTDTADVRRQKMAFMGSVIPIHPSRLIAAQYKEYEIHGREEFGDESFHTVTPTFGAVALQVSGARWAGVPMFLYSGKALDAKSSFIRVVFKRLGMGAGAESTRSPDELVLSFGPHWLGCQTGPCLVVSKGVLGGRPLASPWHLQQDTASRSSVVYNYPKEDRAYSVVVSNLFHGRQENFVYADGLMASWNLWNLALARLKTNAALPTYARGDVACLGFRLTPTGLGFVNRSMDGEHTSKLDATIETGNDKVSYISLEGRESFREVVVKPFLPLMLALVERLQLESTKALKRSPHFHVAVPGGRTPLPVFQLLASEGGFPWSRTHFWFTDERCVPPDHGDSNLRNAEESLFRHVPAAVHPMPVQLARGLCHPDDLGSHLYASEMSRVMGNDSSLDVVILGVGFDGHVASLFPGFGPKSNEGSLPLVLLHDPPPKVTPAVRRMSLSLDAIGTARTLFVVITGRDKHGVVQEIMEGSLSPKNFPVKGLHAVEEAILFLDNDAYFG